KFDQSGTSDFLFACPDSLTMRQVAPASLSARPPSLLKAQLPYDDLLKSPERFDGRPCGRAFRSVEGSEAPRGYVLQRRIFLPVEYVFAGRAHGGSLSRAGRRTRNHLPLAHRRARLCPAVGWGEHSTHRG